jgi:MipA family protein
MRRANHRSFTDRSLTVPACVALLAAMLTMRSPSVLAEGPEDSSKEGELVVSIGASYGTDSLTQGASTEAELFPLIDVAYTRGRFAVGFDGVSYQLVSSDAFGVGVGLGYDLGRKEEDSTRLRGMGDVRGSAFVGLFADWRLLDGLLTLSASTAGATRRENGVTAALEATVAYPLAGEKVIGFLSLAANFADEKYMQTYYGVTPSQSARSGYRTLTPESGLYESAVTLGFEYAINKKWSTTLLLGSTRREGDAAESPIFTRRNEPAVSLFASRRF